MLGRWAPYRPPARDVAVAAVFLALGQAVTWGRLLEPPSAFAGSRPVNAAFNLILMLTLAWRRRAPFAAVCWAVAGYFLPHAVVPLDVPFLAGAVPLIVLTASAGYHCPRSRAVLAAGASLLGLAVVLASAPSLRSPDSFAINAAFLLVPWLGARALRDREIRAATLATALASERAAADAELREATAAERARIARELHDIVAHSVSMMLIQVGAARLRSHRGPEAVDGPLLDAEQVGRQALADLRRLLGVLRADGNEEAATAPPPPQPGLSQLDDLLSRTRAAGLDVTYEVAGDPTPLPAAVELTAYRIVQEALTNTLRHGATATQAAVRLTYTQSALRIDVVDDGTGSCSGGAGHGLVGMAERASLFGGTVTAGPSKSGGWSVRAELGLPVP